MTATIKSARRAEGDKATWTNPDNVTFQRWLVTVQNGEQEISTDILRKPESPDPTGLPVEQKNGRWKVAQQQGDYKGAGKDFKADPVKLRAENRRSALHAAVSRANGIGPNIDGGQIVQMAEVFHRYIEADGTS